MILAEFRSEIDSLGGFVETIPGEAKDSRYIVQFTRGSRIVMALMEGYEVSKACLSDFGGAARINPTDPAYILEFIFGLDQKWERGEYWKYQQKGRTPEEIKNYQKRMGTP